MAWAEAENAQAYGCFGEADSEGDLFFDSREQFSDGDCSPAFPILFGHDWQVRNFASVKYRKARFLRWMKVAMQLHDSSSEDEEHLPDPLITEISEQVFPRRECPRFLQESFGENEKKDENPPMDARPIRESTSSQCGAAEGIGMLPLTKKVRVALQRKLGVAECFTGMGTATEEEGCGILDSAKKAGLKAVPVYCRGKKLRELSCLCAGQVLHAHDGSVSAMKFSMDGVYLATGGEDAVICVWKVVNTDKKFAAAAAARNDPSSSIYSVDDELRLSPLDVRMYRHGRNTTCVIIPEQVFHFTEEPVHTFRGHGGEVLSLSWSSGESDTRQFLLSASVDRTVRLWGIGHEQCLRVFVHSDYVTCVEFKPSDDNHFISGSIDGKVRVWEVSRSRVVDWIDVKEIVTSVCYRPDGEGGIIGSLSGYCRFYSSKDNGLHTDGERSIGMHAGKKRIFGFQYSPADVGDVVVVSAGSRVRTLSAAARMACKFDGVRRGGSHTSACFTPDGTHLISVDDGSNVVMWNHRRHGRKAITQRACEAFVTRDARMASVWRDPRCPSSFSMDPACLHGKSAAVAACPGDGLHSYLPPMLGKSEYRALRAASAELPHLWGAVIITAGWDGMIRTFHNYGLPAHI